MIGRQLGHFRVVEEIGAGGMGVVYKATDLRLHRPVALKLLPPAGSSDPERRSRLEREARAASALNHPNIVTIHEIDSAEGVDFIAMEHVEGKTLEALIGASGLDLTEALSYAVQIAGALAAAHAHGIVHRDLKPRNVMVTAQGQVKVLDFGLARRVQGTADTEASTLSAEPRTASGAIVGTVAYMSPEQADGRAVDGRSDIFSFGVVLYEMLTGRRPFTGASQAQVLSAILRDQPQAARSIRPGVPAELDRILEKALDKDVACRYQHVDELLADLRRLERAAANLKRAASSGGRGPRRAWGVAAIAVGVAATALALWSARARGPAPAPGRFRLLSTFPGSHRAPSLSPDGRMLAFIDVSRDAPQVFVKYLDEGDPIQVTTDGVAVGRPRWSPKGDQILFERKGEGIWSVPPLGGPSRRVLEEGSCPAFFPDGERIVFDKGEELFTARVDGSDARAVEGVPTNYFSTLVERCAVVSPDGQLLAYYQPERGPFGDFWVVAATGGTPRRLTSDSAEGGGLAWAPDGTSLVVSSARRGARTLWRLHLSGGEPAPVTTGAGADLDPEISGDGRRIVYANARYSRALILLDPTTGHERELLDRRVEVNGPAFSPDGTRLAFFMGTDELEHLFTVGLDGTGLRQVTKRWCAGQRDAPLVRRWLRPLLLSGARAALVSKGGGGGRAEHDRHRRLAVASREQRTTRSRGPQGRVHAVRAGSRSRPPWCATSTRAGRSPSGAASIRPSGPRDGRSLIGPDRSPGVGAAQDPNFDGTLLVCTSEGGPCRAVGQGRYAVWSSDGSKIYFERNRRVFDTPALSSVEAWVMDAEGTNARRIATLGPASALTSEIAVSAMGQIAWVQFRRGREELWLADLQSP